MPPQTAGNARPLPKFGEWDVNNPAAGEGFTVIFNKARDQKKISGSSTSSSGQPADNHSAADNASNDKKDKKPKKLLCCFYGGVPPQER